MNAGYPPRPRPHWVNIGDFVPFEGVVACREGTPPRDEGALLLVAEGGTNSQRKGTVLKWGAPRTTEEQRLEMEGATRDGRTHRLATERCQLKMEDVAA